MDQATLIATEYISTLDNLPSEVQHLLAEIRFKENRSQELLQRIQSRTQSYIRHTIRPGTGPKDKDLLLPQKVQTDYEEVEKLGKQKIELANRLVELLSRACGRLDFDLGRIHSANGDTLPEVPPSLSTSVSNSGPADGWSSARTARDKLKESLKNEISLGSPEPAVVSQPVVVPNYTSVPPKRRRMNTPSSSQFPSPAPPGPSNHPRSRLSLQLHPRHSARRSASVPDQDEEMEDDDGNPNGDPEDQQLYCYCRRLSYGEMIGCDNPDCPYQWFHLNCAGLKPPLPENWYCEDCAPKVTAGPMGRKGRKRGG